MPEVSVIIPNWNGYEFLPDCLSSLKKQEFEDFEVIVVDNGSADNSVDFIQTRFPQVKVIELNKNIGFAAAVNLGIKVACGKYIALINNDTKVDKNCLKYLVQAMKEHPDAGMVAAKMLNFHHPEIIDSAGDYIDAVGHANNIGLGEKDGPKFNREGYVFLVTGGGGLFKKEVFDMVGLLDEDYFAYFEDVDLCLRAQMYGFKGWYQPKAVILHIHKATANRNKAFTEYLQFRNMTMTIIKNFPTELLLRDFNWVKIILVNINTVRFLISQGYGLAALKAEVYILFNFLRLLRRRSQIQKQMKVDPGYIAGNIRPKKVTLFGLLEPGF